MIIAAFNQKKCYFCTLHLQITKLNSIYLLNIVNLDKHLNKKIFSKHQNKHHTMKKVINFIFILLIINIMQAQAPDGYYNEAIGKSGRELQVALSGIIDNHVVVGYDELWYYFTKTDMKPDSTLWDIYTNPYCSFRYTDHGTVYSGECYTYNREHSFCQSWFGYNYGAPYSDIHHIYPVDSWINSTRNNYPYGEVQNAATTFQNGSKFGRNSYISTIDSTPATNAFEPINEFKGDIARSFFYMATRYMFEDEGFATDQPMTYKSQLRPWALEMLLSWHVLDPVSPKEQERNNAIYSIQQNRNPYIDYPELVNLVWGPDSLTNTFSTEYVEVVRPRVIEFEVNSATSITITFDSNMVSSSVIQPNNYTINRGIGVDSIAVDAPNQVTLTLNNPIIIGLSYYCVLRRLQGENGFFMTDTAITFDYGYSDQHTVLVAWTFDNIPEETLISNKYIAANYGMLSQNATLYFNGQYGSSYFYYDELENYTGSQIGDPRGDSAFAGQTFCIQNQSANGGSFVLKFPTTHYKDILLTYACRVTNTGFYLYYYEWSPDGVHYTPLTGEVVNLVGQITPETFELQTIDFQDVNDMEQQDSVFIRISLGGATSAQGNVRFDNFCIHGRKCADNYIVYDTIVRGSAYHEHGFSIPISQTQALGNFQYQRQITMENRCDSMITLILTVENGTGIEEHTTESFMLFPNPAKETVNVKGDNIKCIQLINCIGQNLRRFEVNGANNYSFSVSSYQPGIYFVAVETMTKEKIIKKLIIKH